MKTIYTTLPIYDKIEKQCFQRARKAVTNKVVPVITPRHRLPSFQWKDESDGATTVLKIEMIDTAGAITDITTYFPELPVSFVITGDVYFQHKGETLKYLLDPGLYYLKIQAQDAGGFYFYYWSEWFLVTCVYTNLISSWVNDTYNIFDTSGTAITTAMEGSAVTNIAQSGESFYMRKGESVTLISYFTLGYDDIPDVYLEHSNIETFIAGLNVITLTATEEGLTKVYLKSINTTNFSLSEVFVFRNYSAKYLTINFSNTCDLGDILYQDGFAQTVWFESETMEPSFPNEEEGQKNSDGKFFRTFARQVKKYLSRTMEMPDFMVDVFNRMKLHDTISITDLVGDTYTLHNLEVEHEWLWDDKYYAKIDLTFDYDETVLISACCSNIP